MQHFRPTLALKPLISLQPILYLLPLLSHNRLLLLAVSLHLLLPLSLTPSGFFNGMLEVSKPGALNCYTLFRLILLTLFVYRNLTLTHLPLSRSLDSLLCDLIASPTGLAFSFVILAGVGPLAAASSFSSGRAYLSLNFHLLFFFA